ncbi:hypothetical protein EDD11_001082 [Mortierella claussenii]|nr:hypothetical protein EDD11_001082 [Mortierella claussenii]
MFTQPNRRSRQQQQTLASGTGLIVDSPYPTRLNFYTAPPPLEISIEEFEQFALDRMQVLTTLLTAQTRNLTPEQLDKSMGEAIKKHMPMANSVSGTMTTRQLMDQRRKDHVSHFILRLAYSRRYRFEKELSKDQTDFIKTLNVNWTEVSSGAKEKLKEKLRVSSYKIQNVDEETYFEVDFERVAALVGRRQVYLQGGRAYVPLADQVVLVLDEFKERLSHALEVTGRALPRMDEDDRLMPVLNNINKQYLGREFTTSAVAGEIQAQDVDGLKVHMPLCMEHLHSELRREKHTRHGGRMQYGLFLKGIGLSMEQALIFWQTAFGKLTPDQFNKQYAYNIRHSYGMEGKRTDYTPFSCRHIIQNNAPGPDDHHGCPFRHFGAPKLRATLASHQVDDFDTEDIMNLVQGRHYQIACTRYYEVTRARMLDISTDNLKGGGMNGGQGNAGMVASQEIIEHPNQFFEQSYLLMKNRNAAMSTAGGTGESMDGETPASLQPTVKGQYTYKKAGASSFASRDMEM